MHRHDPIKSDVAGRASADVLCDRQQSSEASVVRLKIKKLTVRPIFLKNIFEPFQLTFTPSWGKRDAASLTSAGAAAQMVGGSSMYPGAENNCKTSLDSMMIIYRLIQVYFA